MSTIDSHNKKEEDKSIATHLAFAVEAIATWPTWQQGLLQASAQSKLSKPRTIKTGVKPEIDSSDK